MHEHVATTIIRGDEAETLGRVVPLHHARHVLDRSGLARSARIGRATRGAAETAAAATGAAEAVPTAATAAVATAATCVAATAGPGACADTTRTARAAGLGRGCVHAHDFRHLRAALACCHLHDQLRAGLEFAVAGRLDRTNVEEGVAGPVGELRKTEALLRVEPLHRSLLLGAGRSHRGAWTAAAAHGGAGRG
jgi:hypothetical protein